MPVLQIAFFPICFTLLHQYIINCLTLYTLLHYFSRFKMMSVSLLDSEVQSEIDTKMASLGYHLDT